MRRFFFPPGDFRNKRFFVFFPSGDFGIRDMFFFLFFFFCVVLVLVLVLVLLLVRLQFLGTNFAKFREFDRAR